MLNEKRRKPGSLVAPLRRYSFNMPFPAALVLPRLKVSKQLEGDSVLYLKEILAHDRIV